MRILNVGTSKTIRVIELIKIIEKILNIKANKKYLPSLQGDVSKTYADDKNLRSIIKTRSKTTYHDGIKKTVMVSKIHKKIICVEYWVGTNFQKKPSIEVLRKLSQNIYSRGPDAYGEYETEYLSLVHRRLSIIDLKERSNQPFIDNQTGNLIIYNGEIYNFKEIKNEILSKYSDINFQTFGRYW